MLFKESSIINVDRSGSKLNKIFHVYSRMWRRYAVIGEYVKVSVKTLERWPTRIRGKRYRPTRPGFILRGFNCMNVTNKNYNGFLKITAATNHMITLKKRGVIKSPYILGPIFRPLRVKKFFYIFNKVVIICYCINLVLKNILCS